MASIVVGIYQSISKAQSAVSALLESGFGWETVSVVLGMATLVDDDALVAAEQCGPMVALDEDTGRMVVLAAGFLAAGPLALLVQPADSRDSERVLPALLSAAGMDAPVVRYLKDAVSAGAILVAVQCDDRRVDHARGILRAPGSSRQSAVPLVGERAYLDDIEALASSWEGRYGKVSLQ